MAPKLKPYPSFATLSAIAADWPAEINQAIDPQYRWIQTLPFAKTKQ